MLDVVHAFEKASGVKINYQIVERRAGDVAGYYSDTTKASKLFGWKAKYGIDKMCEDIWNFYKMLKEGEK